jgi:hypothetical protein
MMLIKKNVLPSHTAIGPPHPPILFVSPLPLCASSSNIYLKAQGACDARGGHREHCRPQRNITLCDTKKGNIIICIVVVVAPPLQ